MPQPKQSTNSPSRTARGQQLPDFRMPAMPPLDLFAAIDRGIRALIRRRRLNRQLRCDAHLLDDIGQSDSSLRDAMKLRAGAVSDPAGRARS